MQIGACGGFDRVEDIKAAGFDYIEMSVPGLLIPDKSDEEFAKNLEQLRKCGLPCPVVNCFIPGDIKITGDSVDKDRLYKYAATAIARAQEAGIQAIVFGSGGARNIPEGFDRGIAWRLVREFARFCAEEAAKHNVTIVLEPLNSKECNIFTTVAEGAKLVREVDHENFRLLVDAYHWGIENEPDSNITDNMDLLRHSHVATWPSRIAPGREECAMENFFQLMRDNGYTGRISFEGKVEDVKADLALAHKVMREMSGSGVSAR
jgi:sugar phosphate isomerase/epimerase